MSSNSRNAPNAATDNAFGLLGLVAFPVVWYVADIYWATAVLMGVFAGQIPVKLALRQPLTKSVWAMTALVLCMGALTLLLRDKAYIQIKTSVVYACFAVILLFCQFVLQKNLLRVVLQQFFTASDRLWRNTSLALAAYFAVLAVCNWVVLMHFSEAVWVSVKTFGFPAATFLFTLAIVICLAKYGQMVETDKEGKPQ